jgi:hypothetical protein
LALPLKAGDPGKFTMTYTITTNLTEPFTIAVVAESVKPKLQFVGLEGSLITGIVLGMQNESITVHLRNIGKADVVIEPAISTSRVFRVRSNCTEVRAPNTSCDVNVTMDVRMIRSETEMGTFSVNASRKIYNLDLKFVLTPEEMRRLERERALRYAAVMVVLYGSVIGPIVLVVVAWIRVSFDFKRRSRRTTPRCECCCQGAQVILCEGHTGGVWGPTDAKVQVTGEALSEMAALIANLTHL